jgi:hypothetical protein
VNAARDPDRLFKLLPAVDRANDALVGGQLRALLRVIGSSVEDVRLDVQRLWDDAFIETCERWVIPYIGDLIGNRALRDVDLDAMAATAQALFADLAGPNLRPPAAVRNRADVANTIGYRRRKGTLAMLELLASDVTGWPAHAVEFFELLAWNQNVNHLRPQSTGCVDVRDVERCGRIDRAFDVASHTVDVRPPDQRTGRYVMPNIGFFLWRLESTPLHDVPPRAVPASPFRLTFSRLGNTAPLFTARPADAVAPSREDTVTGPIRPERFFAAKAEFYGEDKSFALYDGGTFVPPAQIVCMNLRTWSTLARPIGTEIGVDVARGRIMPGTLRDPAKLTATYHAGFPARMGGGEYERSKWLVRRNAATVTIVVGSALALTLDAAIDAWQLAPANNTIIVLSDSGTYTCSRKLALDPQHWLTIEAADKKCPHVVVSTPDGVLHVDALHAGSSLTLSGIVLEGALQVDQDCKRLRLLHSTIVPGRSIAEEVGSPPSGPAIDVGSGGAQPRNAGLRVELAFSITGPIRAPREMDELVLLDSIVDGAAAGGVAAAQAIGNALGTAGPAATIERSTIFGEALFKKLPLASESIFTGRVTVEERGTDCVRFCALPAGSRTGQQYRCVAFAAAGAPAFASVHYGHPHYAQLLRATPVSIREGAADGSEMGAFRHLAYPIREANLRLRLTEYLPFGLVADLIFVT